MSSTITNIAIILVFILLSSSINAITTELLTRRYPFCGYIFRPSKQPERRYKIENTNYKVRNVKNNIFGVNSPIDKEDALSFFSNVLSASPYSSTFTFHEVPKEDDLLSTFTKQVSTLGPATSNVDSIRSLFDAGADVFRLNFSHGTRTQKLKCAMVIRQLERETDGLSLIRHKAILGDIQGPKIRIGRFMPNLDVAGKSPNNKDCEFVNLKKGDEFTFDPYDIRGTNKRVQLNYPEILEKLQVGNIIILDDGNISMTVTSCNPLEPSVTARVENDCVLSSRKGFSVPDAILPVEFLGEKDIKDLVFCLSIGLDYLGISFVQSGNDLKYLLNIIEDFYSSKYFNELESRVNNLYFNDLNEDEEDEQVESILNRYYTEHFSSSKEKFKKSVSAVKLQKKIGIIPKIEKQSALDDIHNILKLSNGLMVARGDLGIETELTNLPAVQKRLVQLCRLVYHKPCIVATQMLESMRFTTRPTRAEVSDVFNAVYDGADAVMLSAESATGNYPALSVSTQRKILYNAEHDPYYCSAQIVKELLFADEGLLSNIRERRPSLYDSLNLLLSIDTTHANNWSAAHSDLLNSVAVITGSLNSVDGLVVYTNDDLDLVNWISSKRHLTPILLVTDNINLARQAQLTWGVKAQLISNNLPEEISKDAILKLYGSNVNKVLFIEVKDNKIKASKTLELQGT